MKIHVGSFDSRKGVKHFAARTEDELWRKMAAHVWEELIPRGSSGFNGAEGKELLDRYVQSRGPDPDEWYDTSEVELEDGPPLVEGRVRGRKPRMLQRFKAQPLRPAPPEQRERR